MCDYSLQTYKSRPAAVGDRLVLHNFNSGTRGFVSVDDMDAAKTAVCCLPGTELAFEGPIEAFTGMPAIWEEVGKAMGMLTENPRTAIFRQVNKDQPRTHHDCLEFPNGRTLMLTYLKEGQRATVLQLPAQPKTEQEAEAQKRAEYV